MSGIYADVPGHRFAYDVDGTAIRYRYYDNSFAAVPAAGPILNDEDETDYVEFGNLSTGVNFFTTGGTTGFYLTLIFPQLRDVAAYFMRATVQAITIATHRSDVIQTSPDTTDGSDGTWTTRQAANFPYSTAVGQILPRSRDSIQTLVGATAIKGIRFSIAKDNASGSNNDYFRMYALHLYGTITGSNNGLRFWHPTLDQEVDKANFDFGDMAQSTARTKQFRLKNTSSQQANTIVLSAEGQSGSDAGLVNGLTFSLDDVTYATTRTVTSIAAGAISPILYAKRTVGAAEAALVRNARLKAAVGSWT